MNKQMGQLAGEVAAIKQLTEVHHDTVDVKMQLQEQNHALVDISVI